MESESFGQFTHALIPLKLERLRLNSKVIRREQTEQVNIYVQSVEINLKNPPNVCQR